MTAPPIRYCSHCQHPYDGHSGSCRECYAYGGNVTSTQDPEKLAAYLARKARRQEVAQWPAIDERREDGTGPVWGQARPDYRQPHVTVRSATVYAVSRYNPGKGRVTAYSQWSYRAECHGCGAVEQASVCSSVTAEDAPGYFAAKHADCA